MRRSLHYFICMFFIINLQGCSQEDGVIRVLILSGSNNHEWKQTTPQLERIFSQSGLFQYQVSNQPDTLRTVHLASFDVIVSNWNSWPENDLRWPEETESALLQFIKDGGGFVTFHASSSVFYKWPEFKKISTAAWVMDTTGHGNILPVNVKIQDIGHTITRGMASFYIQDELWVNAEVNTNFTVLGTATNAELAEKDIEDQPAIMVSKYGKGRIFHTILGHDARTMRNQGFITLMLRGTEWAATGSVSQTIPQELQAEYNTEGEFNWVETDSSFALLKGQNIIWKYNFNEMHGKPFFHPIMLGRNNLTCVSPDDHPWHLGQWFSWKYINGVNYWEYMNANYQSEGVTEIRNIEIIPNADFSADINLDIVYHPIEGENVMAENRIIKVSPPPENGNLSMEYTFSFEALVDSVDLNRTPIIGEPGGQSWGGYSGLSIRFNQDFMDPQYISGWGEDNDVSGKAGDWLYMGFTGLDGNTVGSVIMTDPDSQLEGNAWYAINDRNLPFFYFSPACIYYEPVLLLKGEKLELKYRVEHLSGLADKRNLEKTFREYKLKNK